MMYLRFFSLVFTLIIRFLMTFSCLQIWGILVLLAAVEKMGHNILICHLDHF